MIELHVKVLPKSSSEGRWVLQVGCVSINNHSPCLLSKAAKACRAGKKPPVPSPCLLRSQSEQ